MRVFEASSPQIEILGDAIIPVLKGISSQKVVTHFLAEFGLQDVQKGRFYPQQHYLDLLRKIHETMPLVLLKIGENIFAEAVFPPQIDSFEKALLSIDTAYHLNHRGGEIGHYAASKLGAKLYRMDCNNPYPCNFDMGIMRGIAKQFDTRLAINHYGDECRTRGDLNCCYQIELL